MIIKHVVIAQMGEKSLPHRWFEGIVSANRQNTCEPIVKDDMELRRDFPSSKVQNERNQGRMTRSKTQQTSHGVTGVSILVACAHPVVEGPKHSRGIPKHACHENVFMRIVF